MKSKATSRKRSVKKQIKSPKKKKSPRVRYDNDRKMSGRVGNMTFNYDPETQVDWLFENARLKGF